MACALAPDTDLQGLTCVLALDLYISLVMSGRPSTSPQLPFEPAIIV